MFEYQKCGDNNMSSQEREVSGTGLLIKIILPLCLIVIGVAGWSYFNSKEPKMKRKPHKKQIPLVEVISLKTGNYQSWIYAMGTVMPDKEIILKSKAGGEVTFISPDFVQGGVMKKGETLLKIDDSDYRIDIKKAKTTLDKALADFAIEKGSQIIAKEELKLINKASQNEIKARRLRTLLASSSFSTRKESIPPKPFACLRESSWPG